MHIPDQNTIINLYTGGCFTQSKHTPKSVQNGTRGNRHQIVQRKSTHWLVYECVWQSKDNQTACQTYSSDVRMFECTGNNSIKSRTFATRSHARSIVWKLRPYLAACLNLRAGKFAIHLIRQRHLRGSPNRPLPHPRTICVLLMKTEILSLRTNTQPLTRQAVCLNAAPDPFAVAGKGTGGRLNKKCKHTKIVASFASEPVRAY